MNRSRSAIVAVVAAGFLFTGPAGADDKPGCHGQNQEDCRPDPNPSGKDCDPHGKGGINDDHCATTTTTVAPTTTTTLLEGLLPTTTATATTATTAAPTTTTTAAPAARQQVPTAVLGANQRRLADTGGPVAFYTALALLALAFGLALRYLGRLEENSP